MLCCISHKFGRGHKQAGCETGRVGGRRLAGGAVTNLGEVSGGLTDGLETQIIIRKLMIEVSFV